MSDPATGDEHELARGSGSGNAPEPGQEAPTTETTALVQPTTPEAVPEEAVPETPTAHQHHRVPNHAHRGSRIAAVHPLYDLLKTMRQKQSPFQMLHREQSSRLRGPSRWTRVL